MTGTPPADTVAGLVELARRHGLDIDADSLRLEEIGLDYRVAFATANDGERWVLRVPRRPDVAERIADEAAVLDAVGPRLTVAVPDWRVRSAELVAYPQLPGEPGLTIDAAGEPVWRVDPTSTAYARAFGALVAELHGIDVEVARAAGMPVESPEQVRRRWSGQVDRVAEGFTVAPELLERWRSWLADDSFWPTWSVLTHGELYPAHVLVDADERPTAVLDWTTAKVGDPGADLALHHMTAGTAAFAVTLEAYEASGGRTWPRLADHCAEIVAANPVGYGIYALETGDPTHRAAAQELLDPA